MKRKLHLDNGRGSRLQALCARTFATVLPQGREHGVETVLVCGHCLSRATILEHPLGVIEQVLQRRALEKE